jgi:uncharacterized RDD family membrane protein YckC
MSTSEPHPQAGVVGFQLSALRAYGTEAGTIEGVGFWPRAAARVIDLLVHILVGFCAGFLFTIVQMIAAGGHPDRLLVLKLQQTTFASFLLAILGSLVYHTSCEGLHGSTLGKLVLSMVVVQEDGSPCRLKGAVVRSMGDLLDALFFGLSVIPQCRRRRRNNGTGTNGRTLSSASAQTRLREVCGAEAGLSWPCFSQSWLMRR